MRKLNIIISCTVIMLFTFLHGVQAQTTVALNEIERGSLTIIKNKGTPSERKFTLSVTPSGLVAALGPPVSTSTERGEIDNTKLKVYTYKGAEFSFNGNSLVQFYITNAPYLSIKTSPVVHIKNPNKYYFSIGEPVSRIETTYPTSFKASRDGSAFFVLFKWTQKGTPPKATMVKTKYDDNLAFLSEKEVITGFLYEQ